MKYYANYVIHVYGIIHGHLANAVQVGVTKPILSVPLFTQFF